MKEICTSSYSQEGGARVNESNVFHHLPPYLSLRHGHLSLLYFATLRYRLLHYFRVLSQSAQRKTSMAMVATNESNYWYVVCISCPKCHHFVSRTLPELLIQNIHFRCRFCHTRMTVQKRIKIPWGSLHE